jgi:hypothetical protein
MDRPDFHLGIDDGSRGSFPVAFDTSTMDLSVTGVPAVLDPKFLSMAGVSPDDDVTQIFLLRQKESHG